MIQKAREIYLRQQIRHTTKITVVSWNTSMYPRQLPNVDTNAHFLSQTPEACFRYKVFKASSGGWCGSRSIQISSRGMYCFLPSIRIYAAGSWLSTLQDRGSRACIHMRRNRGETTRPLLRIHSHASGSFSCIVSSKQFQLVYSNLFILPRQCPLCV